MVVEGELAIAEEASKTGSRLIKTIKRKVGTNMNLYELTQADRKIARTVGLGSTII